MADRTPAVASGARSTVAGIVSTRLKVDMDDIYMYESEYEDALFKTLSMISKEKEFGGVCPLGSRILVRHSNHSRFGEGFEFRYKNVWYL